MIPAIFNCCPSVASKLDLHTRVDPGDPGPRFSERSHWPLFFFLFFTSCSSRRRLAPSSRASTTSARTKASTCKHRPTATARQSAPTAAGPNSTIRSMTEPSPSPPAGASACTALSASSTTKPAASNPLQTPPRLTLCSSCLENKSGPEPKWLAGGTAPGNKPSLFFWFQLIGYRTLTAFNSSSRVTSSAPSSRASHR